MSRSVTVRAGGRGVAADKESLVLPDVLLGVNRLYQHLGESDQDAQRLLLEGDGGMKLYIHDQILKLKWIACDMNITTK
ncbi:MAG: hypothetical protein A4E45_00364 [Methanosaeta sp. PtaB.Bin039]|nr:MAG: hypothetical protein A4E45_00364 [Methanosaeta sp. PtaB.Bin039]HOT06261.1 hypothetical protein [Methanotrichaceae archaeon]HQF15702.1 hypothetical protein [Methanotrichaceae archaeon]HQI90625.1 hypothetical protein [Methanotrichaceae archaeon]